MNIENKNPNAILNDYQNQYTALVMEFYQTWRLAGSGIPKLLGLHHKLMELEPLIAVYQELQREVNPPTNQTKRPLKNKTRRDIGYGKTKKA